MNTILQGNGVNIKRYALCVGIGQYKHLPNQTLRYAVDDAKAVAKVLQDEQRGGYAVTLLTKPDETTKSKIDEAIYDLLNEPEHQADDVAVLYFSCHGRQDTDESFYLLPSDADFNKDEPKSHTIFSLNDFAKYLKNPRVHNIIIFLDVCHSGGIGKVYTYMVPNFNKNLNYFFIGGARQDQPAREDGYYRHGLFTECWLRACTQPPEQGNWITVAQMQRYLQQEIRSRYLDEEAFVQITSTSINSQLPLLHYPVHHDITAISSKGNFYGREKEIDELSQYVKDKCKMIAIWGSGGIGKTSLALAFVDRMKGEFTHILGHSFSKTRLPPTAKKFIQDCIFFFSNQEENAIFEDIESQISCLIGYMKKYRCLLILDEVEQILQPNEKVGKFQKEYEEYGQLLLRISETQHQSCILLTTREKLEEVADGENRSEFVRSLHLSSVDINTGLAILQAKGLDVPDEKEGENLIRYCGGNPFTLRLIVEPIKSDGGDIAKFLTARKIPSTPTVVELLEDQFIRISELERDIMFWFAVEREGISLDVLRANIIPLQSEINLGKALTSLEWRSMIEKNQGNYELRPMIRDYVTDKFIEKVEKEIGSRKIGLLASHVFVKAEAKDYIRDSQINFICRPIVEWLSQQKGKMEAEKRLKTILLKLQETKTQRLDYAATNVLRLLLELESDLQGYDFSGLGLFQSCLQNVNLRGVKFVDAVFKKSTFFDMMSSVISVAVSSDGKYFAAGTSSGEIRLWQTFDYMPIGTYIGHKDWVWSIAFSPNREILASSSGDGIIRLWHIHSDQSSLPLTRLTIQNTWFPCIAFSPDGLTLVGGGNDGKVRSWTIPQETNSIQQEINSLKVQNLTNHTSRIWAIAFSSDGQFIASGGADNTIHLWNTKSRRMQRLSTLKYEIRSLAFSPKGNLLASGSSDGIICLWDISSGECIKRLEGHIGKVRSITFSSNGQILISGGEDCNIRLWDIMTEKCFNILQGHTHRVRSIAFIPNNQMIVSGGEDQTIRVWDMKLGELLKTLHGYAHAAWVVAFSPDGNLLAFGSEDNMGVKLRLRDMNTDQTFDPLEGYNDRIRSLAFSPDSKSLACSCEDNKVRIWNTESRQLYKTLPGHHDRVCSVTFSLDGRFLASGSEDKTICLWDINTAESTKTLLVGHTRPIRALAFGPKNLLASGGEDHVALLWTITTGRYHKLEGHTSGIWTIAFSPDGKLLATGSEDNTVRLWNTSGKFLGKLNHGSRVWSVTFSHDGKLLASSGGDSIVRLWDISTRKNVKNLEGHKNQIRSVAAHPTMLRFATASDDGKVMLWDGKTGEDIKTLTIPKPYDQMDITRITGLNFDQIETLKALGAIDNSKRSKMTP